MINSYTGTIKWITLQWNSIEPMCYCLTSEIMLTWRNIYSLRNIYSAIFDSHLTYSEESTTFLDFQNLRSIFFWKRYFQVYWQITSENILFVNKSINRQVPPIFYDWFTFSGVLHRYKTCWSVNNYLNLPTFRTQKYGHFSVRASTIFIHSKTQPQKRLNISLLNILWKKKTNINILGQSFWENYKPKYIYSTSFQLILNNLLN